MQIILTTAAQAFASLHEGPAALVAKVEYEWEQLCARDTPRTEAAFFHIFSWHGESNMIMGPQGEILVVDLINDDDGRISIPLDPTGGVNPDVVPLPQAQRKKL